MSTLMITLILFYDSDLFNKRSKNNIKKPYPEHPQASILSFSRQIIITSIILNFPLKFTSKNWIFGDLI